MPCCACLEGALTTSEWVDVPRRQLLDGGLAGDLLLDKLG